MWARSRPCCSAWAAEDHGLHQREDRPGGRGGFHRPDQHRARPAQKRVPARGQEAAQGNRQEGPPAAAAKDSPAKVQAIAKRFGAQMYITGSANAATGDNKIIGGVRFPRPRPRPTSAPSAATPAALISSIPGGRARGVPRRWTARPPSRPWTGGQVHRPGSGLQHPRSLAGVPVPGRGEIKLEMKASSIADVDKLETASEASRRSRTSTATSTTAWPKWPCSRRSSPRTWPS